MAQEPKLRDSFIAYRDVKNWKKKRKSSFWASKQCGEETTAPNKYLHAKTMA